MSGYSRMQFNIVEIQCDGAFYDHVVYASQQVFIFHCWAKIRSWSAVKQPPWVGGCLVFGPRLPACGYCKFTPHTGILSLLVLGKAHNKGILLFLHQKYMLKVSSRVWRYSIISKSSTEFTSHIWTPLWITETYFSCSASETSCWTMINNKDFTHCFS